MKALIKQAIRQDTKMQSEKRERLLAILEDRIDSRTPPVLLKPTAAARLLDISRVTLWRLTKEGIIKAVRVGADPRYRYQDLLDFANQGETDQ